MNRPLFLLLFVSLALNLAFAGFFIGRSLQSTEATPPPALFEIDSDLAKEERRDILRNLGKIRRQARQHRRADDTPQTTLIETLTRESATRTQIFEALAKTTEKEAVHRLEEFAALADYLAQLSQEERKFVAELFKHNRINRAPRKRQRQTSRGRGPADANPETESK